MSIQMMRIRRETKDVGHQIPKIQSKHTRSYVSSRTAECRERIRERDVDDQVYRHYRYCDVFILLYKYA